MAKISAFALASRKKLIAVYKPGKGRPVSYETVDQRFTVTVPPLDSGRFWLLFERGQFIDGFKKLSGARAHISDVLDKENQ